MHFPTVYDFANISNQYLHEPYASLLNGIIFGIKPKASPELYYKLKATGLLHIAVLSGMNLSLLSAVVSQFTLFLGKKISSLISILTIILFVEFVGPQAPIVRAAIMAILTHVAYVYGKQKSTLYLLFLSGLLSIIFKPTWIKSLSFQLSYLATLGLILFAKRKIKRATSKFEKIKNTFQEEFITSIAAQVFTAPLIFLRFKQISLVSPFTNALVSPLIAPLMIFGLLTSILGKINYFLGLPFAFLSFGILKYLTSVIDLFSKIPFAFVQF